MKQIVLYLLLTVLFLGCQDVDRPEKPDDLISEEEMVNILTDVYIANAARSVNNRALRERGLKLDSAIYRKYNIDSVQFAKSNAWYTSSLNTYNAIFKQVQQKLELLKTQADSLVDERVTEFKDTESVDSLLETPQLTEPIESEIDQDSLL
jgi:hypothetical protein